MSARIERVPPTPRRRLFVHIGTHKTGTTSFQKWLMTNEPLLLERFGLGVYHGAFPNAREIGLACANTDRLLPVRHLPQWNDPTWRAHVGDIIQAQLARDVPSMILSAESLSFLRAPEEIRRVSEMMTNHDVTILVTLRNPVEFLGSWERHLTRGGYELSDNPASFAYVKHDSWLARYDQLIDAYAAVFGRDRVLTIDYESANAEFGSVIPALMRHVVDDIERLPEWSHLRLNSTIRFESARQPTTKQILARLIGPLRRALRR